VVVAIPHLLTLLNQIAPQYDDAWFASRAWAVIHTGWAYGPLDRGAFDAFEGHQTYFWLVGTWFDSVFIRLFGANLLATRLPSFVCGLVLLTLIYAIASKLYSRRVGLLAILAGAFSYSYIFSSHVGRQDIMVAALGYGAILLYLSQDNSALSLRSFLSGLALGITLDIHPTGLIFPPVVAALFLFDYKLKVLHTGRAWGSLAGFLCAVGYFLAVHVLPYPSTFFSIGKLQQGSGITGLPITQVDPVAWIDSFHGLFNILDLSACLLGVVSLVILLRRPLHSDLQLVIMLGTLLFAMVAIVARKPVYYAILVSPMIWLLLGAGADRILQNMRGVANTRATRLRAGLVLATLCVASLGNLPFLLQNHYGDFEAAMDFVQKTVPAGASIISEQTYWFARPDDPYYAWEQFTYYRRFKPGSNLVDALSALHPDYIIMDGVTDNFLVDDNSLPYFDSTVNVAVPRAEMESFLTTETTLVSQTTNDTFGNIRIYRINW
jgi:hypothetical protein